MVRLRGKMGSLKGVARVDGQVVCEGQMTFALGDPAATALTRRDGRRGGSPGDVPLPAAAGARGPAVARARALQVRRLLAQGGGARDRGRPRRGRTAQVVRLPSRRIDPRRDADHRRRAPVGDETERVVIALHKPVGSSPRAPTPAAGPPSTSCWATSAAGSSRWAASTATPPACWCSRTTIASASASPIPSTTCRRRTTCACAACPDAEALRALREGAPLGDGEPRVRPRVRALGSARGGGAGSRSCSPRARTARCAACARRSATTCRPGARRDRRARPGRPGPRALAAPRRGRGRRPGRAADSIAALPRGGS